MCYNFEVQRTPLGVVDTFAKGFTMVNRRLWVVAIIIALDLVLWLGPKVSISPLLDDGLNWYHHLLVQSSLQFGPQQALRPDEIEQLYTQTSLALEPLRQVNLLATLAWNLPCLIKIGASSGLGPLGGKVMALDMWSWFLMLLVGLGAVGLLGSCLYLGALAHLARGESIRGAALVRSLGRNWLRLVLYFILLGILGLLLVPPLLLASGTVAGLNPLGAGLVAVIAFIVMLCLMFTLFFVDDAIFVSNAGVLKAIWYSANIVWRNLWSALAFFLVANVILLGMPVAWGLILGHPVGVVVAILGNAYIATGVLTASMLYYWERFAQWRSPSQEGRSLAT